MTACEQYGVVISANDLFKLRYRIYLRGAALTAILLTILFFILMPRYEPTAYKLRSTAIEIIEFEEDVPIIEEPAPPPPLRIPPVVEAAPDDAVVEDFDPGIFDIDFDRGPPQVGRGDPDDGDVFVVAQSKPVLTYYHQPDYPSMARLMRLTGTVVVEVKVGKMGQVEAVKIARGVHPVLDEAAQTAARRCRFQPGTQRTVPVVAWVAIPYRFVLN